MKFNTYHKTISAFFATKGLLILMIGIYLYSTIDSHTIAHTFSYLDYQGETNIVRQFLPALLHFNFIHLAMNLFAFWSLSNIIVNKEGGWIALLIFIVAGYIGNVAQATFVDHLFLGASGAIMGQAGFILMMKFLDTPDRYSEFPYQIIWNIGFIFLIGFTVNQADFGVKIANIAHLFGMLGGIAFAIVYYFAIIKRKGKIS